jgi:beta-propeller repeat-containing protein
MFIQHAAAFLLDSHIGSNSRRAPAWLAGAALALMAAGCGREPATPPADVTSPRRLAASYGNVPLSFAANQGQSDEQVKFLARGQGYGVFLTPGEAVLSLRAAPSLEGEQGAAVVRMRLAGANRHPRLTGLEPLPGRSHYFIGDDPARWQRDVPNYARVKYTGVYRGIDIVYYGNQRQLEYDIVVAPHADPTRIALAFDGVQALSLDPQGDLVLRTSQGSLTQHKPVVYQEIGGRREPVDGRYALRGDDTIGFQIASYDPTRPLVIDPVLSYSTYLGGGGNDVGNGVAVDAAGNAYVTGQTLSLNFPGASTSPIQPTKEASYDVFVTKFNPAGSALIYSTYLGGSGGDWGYGIAVDAAGNAYVTGETDSPTSGGAGTVPFPRVGAFQPLYKGGGDAFVSKLNSAGSALIYSTYLGGSGTERGYGIAVDAFDNAYVTGHTNSVNGAGNFPTAFPFQSQNGSIGNYDAFVTKFNASGSGLVYSTYLGGTGSEYSIDGGAIALDGNGNAYVGGTTASPNFPGASTSTIQPGNGGGFNDGFVVKFNAAGSALVYSTYLGGNAYDAVNGIAVDANFDAVVAGYTDSPNFPTASPLQGNRNGIGNDAFVSRIDATGTSLLWSTYLGGTGGDIAYEVALDSHGTAFVSGWTASTNFPTAAAVQPVKGGAGDAFVTAINLAGNALVYSTYLGGSVGSEHGYSIAVDSAGTAYVTGKTTSTDFPTVSPLQATFGGSGEDAFLAKIAAAQWLKSLTFAAKGPACGPVTGKIGLLAAAPAGGLTVALVSGNSAATVPGTVIVQAGKLAATFTITRTPVASSSAGDITATVDQQSLHRALTVLPITVKVLTLAPNPVTGGNGVTGTVTLDCGAAPGALTVALSSTATAVAHPDQNSLVFPAGIKVLTFPITTSSVAATKSATIKASARGVSKSKKLTVNP